MSVIDKLNFASGDITPFDSNTVPNIPTSPNFPTYAILFPTNDTNAKEGAGAGKPLSDKYVIKGNFTFTTSTIPAKYTAGDPENLQSAVKFYKDRDKVNDSQLMTVVLSPYVKPPSAPDIIGSYARTTKGFTVKDNGVKLKITIDPAGANPIVYPALTIERRPSVSYGNQWGFTPAGFVLTPNSLYLEDIIIRNLLGKNPNREQDRIDALSLIAGGWATVGGTNLGWGGKPVRYEWDIEFEFDDVSQGTGFFLECEGTLDPQDDQGKNTRPRDGFLFIGEDGRRRSDLKWKRTFTPTFTGLPSPKPIIKYSITSPLSENAVRNKATGPYWRRYPNPSNPSVLTADELFMSSSILNQTYGKPFYQANIPYKGDTNTDFPLTVEPDFIEFDAVIDSWSLREGDQIRFENNEDLTFTITSIEGRTSVIPPANPESNDVNDKLRVVVSPPFEYVDGDGKTIINQPSNFDFFIVRRFKENKNFIILDQQMPYGVISTGKGEIAFSGNDAAVGIQPVSPSSSPGLLLPQYRVGKFNTNPDLVLKDLIEKGIIV